MFVWRINRIKCNENQLSTAMEEGFLAHEDVEDVHQTPETSLTGM